MHSLRLATALPAGALALALAAGPAAAWPGHGHEGGGGWHHGGQGKRASAASPATEARKPGTVSVTGHGESTAAPDMAVVTLGVTVQAPSAAEAMRQNSQRQQVVVDTLRGRGIEPRDIQTSGLNLSPVQDFSREGQPPVVTGYQATNLVTVRVRDLPRLGEALDALVTAGANEIHGIGFQRENLQAAEGEARARAVENARLRAEVMARAAGMGLGRLVEISDVAMQQGPQPMMRAMAQEAADAASVPIQAGELAVAADVTVTWELRPARGDGRRSRPQRQGMGEGEGHPGMGHHGMEHTDGMDHHGMEEGMHGHHGGPSDMDHHGMEDGMHGHHDGPGGMGMTGDPGAAGAAMPNRAPSDGTVPGTRGAATSGQVIAPPPGVPAPAAPPASMPPSDASGGSAPALGTPPAGGEAAPAGSLPAPSTN